MTNFKDKLTVKKGDLGEAIVLKRLEEEGYIVYKTDSDGAHPFDFLAFKQGDTVPTIIEIKSKKSRSYLPDTGFDIHQYEKYVKIRNEHKIKVLLLFIDEVKEEIYGNYLHLMEDEKTINGKVYPLRGTGKYDKNVMYFPLENMITLTYLTKDQVKQLTDLTNSNY